MKALPSHHHHQQQKRQQRIPSLDRRKVWNYECTSHSGHRGLLLHRIQRKGEGSDKTGRGILYRCLDFGEDKVDMKHERWKDLGKAAMCGNSKFKIQIEAL